MSSPATIQKIKKVLPIEGADKIEQAQVLGWTVVVGKGEFKEKDLCVFIEIDSLVPKTPWSEFLFTGPYENRSEVRIKTKKLRGALSQGLVLPISILQGNLKIDQDVSDLLGIKHYEKSEEPTRVERIGPFEKKIRRLLVKLGLYQERDPRGTFPGFVPKTDEVRIQSAPRLLEKLNKKPYVITCKLDGTSFTFAAKNKKYFTCSRNRAYHLNPKLSWYQRLRIYLKGKRFIPTESYYVKISKKYDFEGLFRQKGLDNLAIQGEICGPNIQKNRLGLKEIDLFVFDIFDIKEQTYWPQLHVETFCKENGLKTVPILERGGSFSYTQEDLLEKARGKYPGTENRREGIVVRSASPIYNEGQLLPRISFKVINNEYLLKDED